MTSRRGRSADPRRWLLRVVFVAVLALSLAMASIAVARLDPFGGAPVAAPYAPYTAGPVVPEEEQYAPYTAGPVVPEVPPYAPYTAGPVVHEVWPYAPYTEEAPITHNFLEY